MLEDFLNSTKDLGLEIFLPIHNPRFQLSKRQVQVLRAAASLDYAGPITKQVAQELGIKIKTVESHLNHIYERMGVHESFSAVYRSFHRGTISLDEIFDDKSLNRAKLLIDALTQREKEIIERAALISLGSNALVGVASLASALSIEQGTIVTHLANIYRKLKIHNLAQLGTVAYLCTALPRTIKDQITSYYARKGVMDEFTAVYLALKTRLVRIDGTSYFMQLRSRIGLLTPKENGVIQIMSDLALNRNKVTHQLTARKLCVDVKKVDAHVHNIYRKLGIGTMAELALYAYADRETGRPYLMLADLS